MVKEGIVIGGRASLSKALSPCEEGQAAGLVSPWVEAGLEQLYLGVAFSKPPYTQMDMIVMRTMAGRQLY